MIDWLIDWLIDWVGIDVLAVHPSPVASNFFDKVHKLDSLEMAQKTAVSPSSVPYKM